MRQTLSIDHRLRHIAKCSEVGGGGLLPYTAKTEARPKTTHLACVLSALQRYCVTRTRDSKKSQLSIIHEVYQVDFDIYVEWSFALWK